MPAPAGSARSTRRMRVPVTEMRSSSTVDPDSETSSVSPDATLGIVAYPLFTSCFSIFLRECDRGNEQKKRADTRAQGACESP